MTAGCWPLVRHVAWLPAENTLALQMKQAHDRMLYKVHSTHQAL